MAGYSFTPLYKKLGIKQGFSVKLINPPANYNAMVGDISKHITISNKKGQQVDFVHFFTNSFKEFEKMLPVLKSEIEKDGSIWISWYKKSAKKPTELNEYIIRGTALAIGLVDVKVCAVDNDWSGLKLVYRLKDR
ncbi:MAG TPA: DUF3052 domain-containing protein [Bacteroidia bacterium]|jgi:hypothetical protein|nr:DUF3052 domain-containing protein [Bacteroidia bacterium]